MSFVKVGFNRTNVLAGSLGGDAGGIALNGKTAAQDSVSGSRDFKSTVMFEQTLKFDFDISEKLFDE